VSARYIVGIDLGTTHTALAYTPIPVDDTAAVAAGPALFGGFPCACRLSLAAHGDFHNLAAGQVPVLLIYSEGDVGLERLNLDFGRRGLSHHGNVTVETIPDADHNLSPPQAQAAYRALLLDAALKAG